MQQQNWDWEQVETIGRGLQNLEYQPLYDPAMYEDPLVSDNLASDPLLDQY